MSDAALALACLAIPLTLAVAARRHDLPLQPQLRLFAAFLLLAGAAHGLGLLTLWLPVYGLEALVKAAAAIAAILAALSLWRLPLAALALPAPTQTQDARPVVTSQELLSQAQLSQAQKVEAAGQLTGGIAHDLNNMLQGITSALTLMERRIAQGRVGETGRYIATMRRASDTAAQLTGRLLAFSRRQASQPRAIEADSLVRGMEELIRRTLGPAIRLDLRLDDGGWDAVCDPNQLEASLLNLTFNARDAMPGGGVLTIATAGRTLTALDLMDYDAKPGNYLEIEVTDTGSGMTPYTMSRVFEPFFTTKTSGEGTGLGLSQVQGFIRQSEGIVRLDSQPGKGTSARLLLPGHERTAGEIAAQASSPELADFTGAQLSKGTVLVVEDQDDVRTQIAEALIEMGCTVVEAGDGLAGLRVLQLRGTFDLVITDVGLPGLNGRQLADAAHAMKPDLPVLLITGYAGTLLDTLQLAQGTEILRKPFSLDELATRVRALLIT
jgi:signal transduction histidine kinase/CheY-like chemotaxis protein